MTDAERTASVSEKLRRQLIRENRNGKGGGMKTLAQRYRITLSPRMAPICGPDQSYGLVTASKGLAHRGWFRLTDHARPPSKP